MANARLARDLGVPPRDAPPLDPSTGEPSLRIILIARRNLTEWEFAHVVRHELAHGWLGHAGKTTRADELACDALASAWARGEDP